MAGRPTGSANRGGAAGPLRVAPPSAVAEASRAAAALPRPPDGTPSPASQALMDAVMAPVIEDMQTCRQNLLDVVGERHPMMRAAADQIFSAGGKRLRPLIVFLVARATAQLQGLRYAV